MEYNTPKLRFVDVAGGIFAFPEILAVRQETCVTSPVTAPIFSATVTAQLAVFPWSTVVTVTLAEPALMALTTPSADTVATASLSLVQVTSLFVALSGVIVASRVNSSPSERDNEVLLRAIPVRLMAFSFTEISHFAFTPLSSDVAVMKAVPTEIASTIPSGVTVATDSLLLLHLIFLFVALSGEIVASSEPWSPTVNSKVLLEREMELTRISSGSC